MGFVRTLTGFVRTLTALCADTDGLCADTNGTLCGHYRHFVRTLTALGKTGAGQRIRDDWRTEA